MSEWSGVVSKVSSRDWGTKTLYSWQLEGANLWFRTEEDPGITTGDAVVFMGESPNKITSVRKVEKAEAKQRAETSHDVRKEAPPTNSPDYWRWKQMHDLSREKAFMWRDARADAVRLVTACLDHDSGEVAKDAILALGNKKSGRLDVLLEIINKLSDHFVAEMQERIDE
jgi:hypothetical protein